MTIYHGWTRPQEHTEMLIKRMREEMEKIREEHWNECTCSPDTDIVCPACSEDIKERLGETIPYDGK